MSFQGTQEGQYKMSVSLTSCNLLWIHWPTTAKLSRGQMAQIIVRKMSERKSNKWTRLAFSACKQKLLVFIPYCLTFLQNITEFGNTLKITDFFFSYAGTGTEHAQLSLLVPKKKKIQLDIRYFQARIHISCINTAGTNTFCLSASLRDSKLDVGRWQHAEKSSLVKRPWNTSVWMKKSIKRPSLH